MKTLLLALAFVATTASAGTAEMVAQCEEVMRCELCRVANDTAPSATKLITYTDAQGHAKVRLVKAADYDYIRRTGYAKSRGKFLMCQRVAAVMKAPDSDRAAGARVMFSADWDGRGYCPPKKP